MLLKVSVLASALLVALGVNTQAVAENRVFDVPAQSAVDAIPELARQARVQIVASAGQLEGVYTPNVAGEMAPREALSQLIAGTGLQIASDEGGVFLLQSGASAPATRSGATTTGVRDESGSIAGQTLDPVTGEYLRNAIIRVTSNGRRLTTTSGERGEYRIANVDAGTVELTVSYTNYADVAMTVEVAPGESVQQDIELFRLSGEGAEASDLDAVRVVGVRDGDARALMEQRASMDIVNSLSVESYGEVSDGNPGEFLKFMPGVDVDTSVDGTVRNVGLRGMPSEYTAILVNGVSMAGADGNPSQGPGSSRSFSFEQSSLSNLDSIEISKTVSADVDANAPAGTINLRTTRAFDRAGRRVTASFSGSTHEDLWRSARTGPSRDGNGGRKFLPNGSFEYSDVFLDRRLGVVASFNESNRYIEREQVEVGRNYNPSANNQDPLAITNIRPKFESREIMRQAASLNLDFRATDNLILSLVTMFNESSIEAGWTNYNFITGARPDGVVGDSALDFTTQRTDGTGTLNIQSTTTYKDGSSRTYIPSFEYSGVNFRLDGSLSHSSSVSKYDPLRNMGTANTASHVIGNGNFHASRGDLLGPDWQITQVSGGDWSDPGSFALPEAFVLRTNSAPRAENTFRSGALNLTFWSDVGSVPVEFKTGLKVSRSEYDYQNRADLDRYSYVGSMSDAELIAAMQGDKQVSFADTGLGLTSLNGSHGIYLPDTYRMLDLFLQNPGDWERTSATSPSEWYRIHVGNSYVYDEDVDALYFMGTAQLSDRLTARAGLRWERTKTDALEHDPLSVEEVADVGYAVNSGTGLATTVEGLQYQFLTNPKTHRKGRYDYFFPSGSIKYSFTDSLDLQVGYSRTIRRPQINQVSGVWTINEEDMRIRAPNVSLEPEVSDNLSIRVAKYFEPVGLVSLNYFQNRVNGLFQSEEMTAGEFGYTGDEYADYTFITTRTVDGDAIRIHGWELEFNHPMDYLPGALSGLSVRGSYTRNSPEIPIAGMADELGSVSLSWRHGPARLNLSGVWTGDKYRSTTPSWWAERWNTSLSGSFHLAKGVEAFFSVNNLLDQDVNVILPNSLWDEGTGGMHTAIYANNGRSANFGVRARF